MPHMSNMPWTSVYCMSAALLLIIIMMDYTTTSDMQQMTNKNPSNKTSWQW